MNTNRKTVECYEDVRDVFVSCKESVFPMETYLDMRNMNYIHNVKTPVNGNQGANKTYVDQNVAKAGDTMLGNLNMGGNRITSLGNATNGSDAINMDFYNKWASFGSRNQHQNFDCKNKTIYNNYISGYNSEVINVTWAKDRYLPLNGSVAMTGNLDLNNEQITNLGLNIQNSNDVICLGFADIKYFQKTAVEKLDIYNHTIDNLPDPTSVLQATHKKYVDKQMNPSHKTNQFYYLMTKRWNGLI